MLPKTADYKMKVQNPDDNRAAALPVQLYHRKVQLNPILVFLAFMYVIGWIKYLTWSSVWVTFLTVCFLLIGLKIFLSTINFIKTGLMRSEIEWTFLVNQFLLVAIPLNVLIIPISLLLLTGFVFVFFIDDFLSVMQRFLLHVLDFFNTTEPPSGNEMEDAGNIFQLPEHIMSHSGEIMGESFPVWKMVVCCIYNSVLPLAFVQQTAYWLVARRVKSVYILRTVHGILSSSCICGLAAAFVQFHVSTTVIPTLFQNGDKLSYYKWRLVIDGLLAFPMHISSMVVIGVAAASRHLNHLTRSQAGFEYLLREEDYTNVSEPTVTKAWFMMVLVHGLYNTVHQLPNTLIQLTVIDKIPNSYLIIDVAKLVLIVLFSVAVKRRVDRVIQRQFVLEHHGNNMSGHNSNKDPTYRRAR